MARISNNRSVRRNCCSLLLMVFVLLFIVELRSTTTTSVVVDAFLSSSSSSSKHHQHQKKTSPFRPLNSIWKNDAFLTTPNDERGVDDDDNVMHDYSTKKMEMTTTSLSETNEKNHGLLAVPRSMFLTAAVALTFLFAVVPPPEAYAVSGGGSDYAGSDISNQDFSNQNYKAKDFTQVIARNTNFVKSILIGCRFQNGYLIDADFTEADLRGVSFERTNMENVILKGANANGAYFDQNLLEAKDVSDVDFTDAQIPMKILPTLCDRPDMKGTNKATGNDTRESAMCL
mmetsp:Transcript_2117/g.2423  ORF Transcript_2117/g.2423 Transcript_2117/m.2423 type:complete len:287 (+) Transcript_2117:51-911(+)